MLQPVRRRTWAPSGQTPIQHAWDRHDRLSAISVVTVSPQRKRLGLYYQLLRVNVRTEELVWFLRQMHRHFRGRIILVWDRLRAHRSASRYFDACHPKWFDWEWLPAYAPELNPVEQCWNHTKYADLANFIPQHVDHLHDAVSSSIEKQQHNQTLIRSFFHYAKLRL